MRNKSIDLEATKKRKIILKKIFNENSSASVTENGTISNKSVPFISNEELELNYIFRFLIFSQFLFNNYVSRQVLGPFLTTQFSCPTATKIFLKMILY